jgi:uncharacterized membrane protein YraQ (UPF0718 family)
MPDFIAYIVDLFRGTYTARILKYFFELAVMVAPYFGISVILNTVLKYWLLDKWKILYSGNRVIAILTGAAAGLISPFPTYIVVPMGFSLISAGLPFEAGAAFMVASPLMNPGIFILTLSQLGWEIAAARVLSTLIIAVMAGLLTRKLEAWFQVGSRRGQPVQIRAHRAIGPEIIHNLVYLGKFFALGLFLSALVRALIPAETISRLLGGKASMSLVAAIALGVPFYSCGGAAIPLVRVLGEMGMNRGAILAFFIAGPSTKIETLVAYKSVMGFRFLIFYLIITLSGAFLGGFLFYYL